MLSLVCVVLVYAINVKMAKYIVSVTGFDGITVVFDYVNDSGNIRLKNIGNAKEVKICRVMEPQQKLK